MKVTLGLIALILLSSCASQSPVLKRGPSSSENCNDIAASLVLNPQDYILEKFRSYLREQKYVDLSSESKFKQTLTTEERKVMAEFQYESQFAKKMDEILAVREAEADLELEKEVEQSFIHFMEDSPYVSMEASLANFFPGTYSFNSFKINKALDRLKSSSDFKLRMEKEFARIEELRKNPPKSALDEWLEGVNFKYLTLKRWQKLDQGQKDNFLNMAADLTGDEEDGLKIVVLSRSSPAGLTDNQKTLYNSAYEQIMREFDDLHGDYRFVPGSEHLSIHFVQTEKGELLGARFTYRAQAKDADDEIIELENSGYGINFDQDGNLVSDPGNMAPVPS